MSSKHGMSQYQLYNSEKQLVSIFKSPKRDEMYLYVQKKAQFEQVPEVLLTQFGQPEHVMDLLLTKDKPLARADTAKVIQEILTNGFYLQMPPKKESLISTLATNTE